MTVCFKYYTFSLWFLGTRINMPETVSNIVTPPYQPSTTGIIATTGMKNNVINNSQTTIPQSAPPSYEEVISGATI